MTLESHLSYEVLGMLIVGPIVAVIGYYASSLREHEPAYWSKREQARGAWLRC